MNSLIDRESALQAVRAWVAAEMEYPYLVNYVPVPALESFQMRMAFAILRAAKVSQQELETVLTALLLIYHGLAVHERIDEASSHSDERYRQLGVLAGDYYSAKYFLILADSGQVPLIGRFAEAVAKINEAKAARDLLAERGGSVKEYIELVTCIFSELLLAAADAYGILPEWKTCILDACQTMAAHQEMNMLSSDYRGFGYHYLTAKCSAAERVVLDSFTGYPKELARVMKLHVKYGTLRNLAEWLTDSYQRTVERVGAVATGISLDFVMRAMDELARLSGDVRTVEEG